MSDETEGTRQERREKKLESRRTSIRQHGRNLARVYKEAIMKRINKMRSDKNKRKKI